MAFEAQYAYGRTCNAPGADFSAEAAAVAPFPRPIAEGAEDFTSSMAGAALPPALSTRSRILLKALQIGARVAHIGRQYFASRAVHHQNRETWMDLPGGEQ